MIKKNNKGYAALELIFYISLFAVLSIAVIDSILVMTKTLQGAKAERELIRGGEIMERMSREIRQAKEIVSVQANNLKITVPDGEGEKEIEFKLNNSNLELIENHTLTGNLNGPGTLVSSVIFSQINTAKGKAVKISLSIASKTNQSRSENYYNTVNL